MVPMPQLEGGPVTLTLQRQIERQKEIVRDKYAKAQAAIDVLYSMQDKLRKLQQDGPKPPPEIAGDVDPTHKVGE